MPLAICGAIKSPIKVFVLKLVSSNSTREKITSDFGSTTAMSICASFLGRYGGSYFSPNYVTISCNSVLSPWSQMMG